MRWPVVAHGHPRRLGRCVVRGCSVVGRRCPRWVDGQGRGAGGRPEVPTVGRRACSVRAATTPGGRTAGRVAPPSPRGARGDDGVAVGVADEPPDRVAAALTTDVSASGAVSAAFGRCAVRSPSITGRVTDRPVARCAAWRSAAVSAAVAGRSAGSLAISRSTTSANASGTPCTRRSGTGSRRIRATVTTISSPGSPPNAGPPVSSANSVAPSPYRSVATGSRRRSMSRSGAAVGGGGPHPPVARVPR